jgi:glycine hydroxymethyltransferase
MPKKAEGFFMDFISRYLDITPKSSRSKAAIAMLASFDYLMEKSPSVATNILRELQDQRRFLKMIASENYSSLAVQLAMGNWMTDKYAEGCVHHRFYAGCEHVDAIEDEACHHLKELFGAEHVYVQPHSGADANLLAFWAILTTRVQSKELERLAKKTIDELTKEEFESLRQVLMNQKLMGLALSSGGHLTHGYRHNISAKIFQTVFYEVDPQTGLLDYDQIWKKAKEEKPLILLAGYSAYPRKINFATMRQIANDVGAVLLVDMAHFSGLVAGKVFEGEYNPVPYADMVTSTTHKTLRGPRGGIILCKNEFREAVDKGCPLVQGGPLPHVMAAKAICFEEAKQPSFQIYAHRIVENARALADELMKRGLSVLTGGTDNHMVLVDVSPLGLTGKQAEHALRLGMITANRNAIPFDKNGPWYTSGVRLGTPALTTLGMGPDEMRVIAACIVDCLRSTKSVTTANGSISRATCDVEPTVLSNVQATVRQMLSKYPLYPEIVLPPIL